jgi:hypothetical protein
MNQESAELRGYVLVLLVVAGYIPWVVPVMFFLMDDYYHWAIEGSNEMVAWSFILSICHLVALVWAVATLKARPAFSSLIAWLALFGLIITFSFGRLSQLGPSSHQDAEGLNLMGFWLDGGWLAACILIIPVSILYFSAVMLRKRRSKSQLSNIGS